MRRILVLWVIAAGKRTFRVSIREINTRQSVGQQRKVRLTAKIASVIAIFKIVSKRT